MRPLLTALALALASTPAIAQAPIEVPIARQELGLFYTSVMLNGHVSARFIVDTAASGTLLSRDTVTRLGLTGSGEPARVEGATGSNDLHHYRLRSLAVGGAVHRNIDAYDLPSLGPLSAADGLLGTDVLRRHVVDFDIARGRMRLYPARFDTRRLSGEWHFVPARQRRDGVLIVAVRIGGETIPALIDTGAVHDFVNRAAAQRLGLHPTAPAEAIGGTSGHVQEMVPVEIPGFAIGEAQYPAARGGAVDLAIFETLGLDGGPAMILGAETLAARRIVIDYPRSRILIAR